MELLKIVALGIYDSEIAKPNIMISQKRNVSMFEFEVPIEDGGTTYINSVSAPIRKNMVICAKPGQVRNTRFPYKCYYIHLVVQEGVILDVLMNTPDFFETDKADHYKQFFSELIYHYNSFSQFEDIKVQSMILDMIYSLHRDVFKRQNKRSFGGNISVVEKTLEYIEHNLTEDLSLNTLAELNSVSPIHFHNVFKTSTGMTLRKYVEEQRLKKAIYLLLTTSLTLTEIAYECGFNSQSYFSYAFKRKMNCSPREYIKNINNNYEL